MTKTYNTPKRTHIVKTRLDDEEHADFLRRLEIYDMNQSEFIREAISGATVKPTIVATLVSDDLLAAVGKLTAEYGRIGNNLNQIARHLNEWHSPYPVMANLPESSGQNDHLIGGITQNVIHQKHLLRYSSYHVDILTTWSELT